MKFAQIKQFTRSGSYNVNISLKHLKEWVEVQKEDGLILNPDFQRGHVWTKNQQIAYAEYFLRGGKSGLDLYFNNPSWSDEKIGYNDFVCVDGLQRITAMLKFVNNEIPVFGFYYKDFEDKPSTLLSFRININDLQTKKAVLQWYIEMNNGGTPHTTKEIERVMEMFLKEAE